MEVNNPLPNQGRGAKLVGWEAGSDTDAAMADFGYAVSSLVPGLPPSRGTRTRSADPANSAEVA
jgi:hypothetical protein